jgi:hypothetical protein
VYACPVVNINVIEALRGSETKVVVAWSSGLSETSERGGNKAGSLLNLKTFISKKLITNLIILLTCTIFHEPLEHCIFKCGLFLY